MTQLIIDNIVLPQTSNDRYQCYPVELSETVEMISGRIVKEVRGWSRVIEYSYDCLDPATWRTLAAALRAGTALAVDYLPDTAAGTALQSGTFIVTNLQNPTFAFSDGGLPVWRNIAFSLREVTSNA